MMTVAELWIQVRYRLGWVFIIVATAIPVIMWTVMLPLSDRFFSPQAGIGSISKVLAIAGLMLYAINLVLAARVRWMEDYFGGLNRVYIAHHLTGGIALIFLLFHPLFLAMGYLVLGSITSFRAAANFLWLRPISLAFPPPEAVMQASAINYGIIAFLGMVALLILTFFVKLPYRIWLFTHKFLGVAFLFAALHILFVFSDTSSNPALKYYLLAWSVLGLVAYTYRTLAGSILVRKYNYHVDAVNRVGDSVVELVMKPVGNPMKFQPGQFVFIRFRYSGDKAITTEAHPFSISSSPKDDFLRLSVKALGDYTTALINLKPGAIAEIEGAYGKFSYTNYTNPKQVWIAGGIGITPFLSMAGSLLPEQELEVDLYYSVKAASEFVDFEKLSNITSTAHHFRTIPWITDERGFLSADAIEKESQTLVGKDFYICGPPGMMKAMRAGLRAKGVPNYRIHSEEFAMS